MADINSVVMVGRLVRDSELKYLQNGQAILRFSIAVNRARRNSDGSWTDEANFFDCVYFGKAAEGVSQYLVKGRQVSSNPRRTEAVALGSRWPDKIQSGDFCQ